MSTMQIMLEAFQYSFFVRAFVAGIFLAMVYALLGNYVVLREEVVIGHTMANVVFMGVAIGLLFSWKGPWVMIISALIGVLFINYLQRTSKFSHNSILELTAQISMATAIVILSQVSGYQNIEGFLFGNILAISNADMWLAVLIFIVNVAGLWLINKPLTRIVINRDLAIASGTRVERTNFIFMLLLALTVAAGIKIIGVVLLAAFLVIPANIAKNIVKSFRQMIMVSVAISLTALIAGLFFSYYFDTPSGAMIVMVLGAMLILTNFLKKAL